MKISTKLNIALFGAVIIILLPVVFLTFNSANRYFHKNFHGSIHHMLDSSSLNLGTQVILGKELSNSFTKDPGLIKWFLEGESSFLLGSNVKKKMIELTKTKGFITTFAASLKTGNYYATENNEVVQDKLSPDNPEDSWFYNLMELPKDASFVLDYSKTLKKAIFWFDFKIFNNNKAIGLAGVGIDLNDALKVMEEGLPSKNSWIGLVNENDIVALSLNEEFQDKNINEIVGPLHEIKDFPSEKHYNDKKLGKVIYTEKKLGDTQYRIVMLIPEKDFIPSVLDIFGISILVSLILLLVVFVLISTVIRKLLKNLTSIQKTFETISKLDLTRRLKPTSNKEFNEISKNMNNMLDEVNGAMSEIKSESLSMSNFSQNLFENMNKSTNNLLKITSEIQEVQGEIEGQSEDISSTFTSITGNTKTIDKLNESIETQSTNIEESSAAVTEMISNIQSVTNILEDNRDSFQELESATGSASETTDKMARVTNKISEDSEGLLEAIQVIQNIASQTNLLAMNAAIEAAHAGESGKGFSVVADEIRKLAEESSVQGKSISTVLKNLKLEIVNVASLSDSVKGAFELISQKTEIFKTQEETIMSAMQEQSSGSGQVLKALSGVGDITEEVKDRSKELLEKSHENLEHMKDLMNKSNKVNTTMIHMSNDISEISDSIKKINDSARKNTESIEKLSDSINRFKTKESDEMMINTYSY